MIRRIMLLLCLGLMASSAHASRTYDKVPAKLDPEKAYVVVEIGKMDGALLFGTLTLGRYDSERMDIALPTPPPGGQIPREGWKQDNRIILNKAAFKDKERRFFIAELDPGLWVVEGANDTAFSLGSQVLDLRAGTVTDLGVADVYTDFPEGEKRDVLTAGRLMKGALMGGIFGSTLPKPMPRAVDFRARAANDLPLPAVVAAAQPVAWTREVQFGNYLGGLVNRMGGRKSRPAAQAEPVIPAPAPAPLAP